MFLLRAVQAAAYLTIFFVWYGVFLGFKILGAIVTHPNFHGGV